MKKLNRIKKEEEEVPQGKETFLVKINFYFKNKIKKREFFLGLMPNF